MITRSLSGPSVCLTKSMLLAFQLDTERGSCIMQCSDALLDLLQRQKELQKLYAASGAAPARVLAYEGEQLSPPISTCYPIERLRNKLPKSTDADVVIWNNVITSQGVGLSLLFAIELGQLLFEGKSDDANSDERKGEVDIGYEKARSVSRRLLVDRTGKLGFRRLVHRDTKNELRYDQPMSLFPSDVNVNAMNIGTPMLSSDVQGPANNETLVRHLLTSTNRTSLLRKAKECTRRFEYTPRKHGKDQSADGDVPSLVQDSQRKSRKRVYPSPDYDRRNSAMGDFSPDVTVPDSATGAPSLGDDNGEVIVKRRLKKKRKLGRPPKQVENAKNSDAPGSMSTTPKNGDPLPAKSKMGKSEHLGGTINTKKTSDAWNTRFQELCEYTRVNGNCNVPNKDTANKKLRNWVNNQKFKKGNLSQEQIELLDSIGFSWGGKWKRGGPEGKLLGKDKTLSGEAANSRSTQKKLQQADNRRREDPEGPPEKMEAPIEQGQETPKLSDRLMRRARTMKTVVSSLQKNVMVEMDNDNSRRVSSPKRSKPGNQAVLVKVASREASSTRTGQRNRAKRGSNHPQNGKSGRSKPKSGNSNELPLTGVSDRPKKKRWTGSFKGSSRVLREASKQRFIEFLQDDMHWTIDKSGRDTCYFPPGVTRKNGKYRKDFFDVLPLVVKYLKSSSEWGSNIQLREMVEACIKEPPNVANGPETRVIMSPTPKKYIKLKSCVVEVEENPTGNALNLTEGGWGDWSDIKRDGTTMDEPDTEERCNDKRGTKVHDLETN